MKLDPVTWGRWLHIQWHRVEIARLSRSKSPAKKQEVARRMNAIALLCDCGRTVRGRRLAESLAEDGGMGMGFSEAQEPS